MTTFSVQPAINFSLSDSKNVEVHSKNVFYEDNNAQSYSANGTSINFTITPPSFNSILSKVIPMKARLQLDFTGTTTGSKLLNDGYDSFRNMPIERSCNTAQATSNSMTFQSNNVRELLVEFSAHYSKWFSEEHPLGMTDQTSIYASALASNRNPLASYTAGFMGQMARGSYNLVSLTDNGTSATLVADLIGYVMVGDLLNPMNYDDLGMDLIKNLSYVLSLDFGVNCKNLWSHASGVSTISTISASIIDTPHLYLKWYIYENLPIPRPQMVRHRYHEFEGYTQTTSTLTNGSSTSIRSNSLVVREVPDFMILWVQEAMNNKTFASTDTALSIDKVSIDFGGASGVLSSATQDELYQIGKKNGCVDDLHQWKGQVMSNLVKIGSVGSFLVLKFGEDISLTSASDLGSNPRNFAMTINFTNNTGATVTTPELHWIFAYSTILEIDSNGNYNKFSEAFDIEREVDLQNMKQVPYTGTGLYGGSVGSFFRKVGKYISKNKLISRGLKAVNPELLEAIPYVGKPLATALPVAQKVAEQLGVGGVVIAGRGGRRGGAVVGAGVASQKTLRDKLKGY
jgi:hypothetical protein